MIAIGEDRQTIYLTVGDTTDLYHRLAFYYPVYNFATGKEEKYKFQLDDKIAFVVKEKKGYTKTEVLRKEYTLAEIGYTEETEYPEIILTEEDTKVFDKLDKKKTYWFDVVLNDTTTILGYDMDGAKKLIVFPEAEEID